MQTRIGVRVLAILAIVAALWVSLPVGSRQISEAAGQAPFNPPATAGCNVPTGIPSTSVTHYIQGDGAGNYTGPNNTGDYLNFVCNYGIRRPVVQPTDGAGLAITVDYCGPAVPAPNKREVGNFNTYDGQHTVHYKRFFKIGSTLVTMAMYTDERSPGTDQFTASEFDGMATALVNRNVPANPPCGGGGGGGNSWSGTVGLTLDKTVADPGQPITLSASVSPSIQGTGLKLVLLAPNGQGGFGILKDCGTVDSCVYAVTADKPLDSVVKAAVVEGAAIKAQSATLPVKWAFTKDWEGQMSFYIGALGRADQGAKEINVKPGVAVPLAVQLDIPVDDTPSQILIYDGPDFLTLCVSGSFCSATVTSATAGTRIYHAKISRPDNTHVQASASLTVTWSSSGSTTACSEGWQYTVYAIEGPASGARLQDAAEDDIGPVAIGQKICAHQFIVTKPGTTVKIRMPGLQSGRLDTWEFTVNPNSIVNIQPHLKNIDGVQGYGVDVEVVNGKTRAKSIDSHQTDITIHGGVGRAGLRGTDAEVEFNQATQTMTVSVYESKVVVTHDGAGFSPVTMYPGERLAMTPSAMSPPVKFTAAFTNKRRVPLVAIGP